MKNNNHKLYIGCISILLIFLLNLKNSWNNYTLNNINLSSFYLNQSIAYSLQEVREVQQKIKVSYVIQPNSIKMLYEGKTNGKPKFPLRVITKRRKSVFYYQIPYMIK